MILWGAIKKVPGDVIIILNRTEYQAMKMTPSKIYTKTGMLRIKYWPLVLIGLYLGYNAICLVAVMMGGEGTADPVLNAPLYWLFS